MTSTAGSTAILAPSSTESIFEGTTLYRPKFLYPLLHHCLRCSFPLHPSIPALASPTGIGLRKEEPSHDYPFGLPTMRALHSLRLRPIKNRSASLPICK